MAQRERSDPLTDEEIETIAEAADDLGKRVVEALAAETDRDPAAFDVDEDRYDFSEPDA